MQVPYGHTGSFYSHAGNREKKVEYRYEDNRRLNKRAGGEVVVFEIIKMKQFCNRALPMFNY